MAEIIANTYQLLERLGSGGGGTVYLAEHLRLNKKVVLKADKRKVTARPELLRREVDVLKNLHDPYIPQVYDYFVENETVYTVMDFVEGESLDRPLKRGERFPQPQVIQWAKQLLRALSYLHEPSHGDPPKGYVHGDIKPANIMRTPQGGIQLIDFNIALALGEENLIGISAGYASPEHYGLDFSFQSGAETVRGMETELVGDAATELVRNDAATELVEPPSTRPATSASSSPKRRVVPDVRSDIYSLGATLYHLLTGRKPNQDAREVEPIRASEASPTVAAIIARAMNPNPDLRYQTAAEMLAAFEGLHRNDPQAVRYRKRRKTAIAAVAALFLLGGALTLAGLGQMNRAEAAARVEAEESQQLEAQARAEAEENERAEAAARAEAEQAEEAENLKNQVLDAIRASEGAYQSGDMPGAAARALEALEAGDAASEDARAALETDTTYLAQAQKALTDALGVYELSGGFRPQLALPLESEALKLALSPDGTRAACLSSGAVEVFDTANGERLQRLPAEPSALADLVFLDESTLIYAGEGALRAVDPATGDELWRGEPATGIALAAGGGAVAAVYKDEPRATVYDAKTGAVRKTVEFPAGQRIAFNDSFADPEDNLFALSADGKWLAASFANGGLSIFSLTDGAEDIEIFDTSEYTHFEGGFHGPYLAFSAMDAESQTVFAVIDAENQEQTGGFELDGRLRVRAGEDAIRLAYQDMLVSIDPVSGEQTELAYTEDDIDAFAAGGGCTLTVSGGELLSTFDAAANCLNESDGAYDLLAVAGTTAAAASPDEPVLHILTREEVPDSLLGTYDVAYAHDEARLSADGSTVTLFSVEGFRIQTPEGEILAEAELPTPERIYDQQYRREDGGSFLDVIYYDGTTRRYSAADGSLVSETVGEAPDKSLYEEFFTDDWRITGPLHGTPEVYDRETGELVRALEPDSYLTYVTQLDGYVVTEYVTADGARYGLLLDGDGETLAELPQLCDVLDDGTLVFDDGCGTLRKSRVYSLEELKDLAREGL